jgi:hypothetical protein
MVASGLRRPRHAGARYDKDATLARMLHSTTRCRNNSTVRSIGERKTHRLAVGFALV